MLTPNERASVTDWLRARPAPTSVHSDTPDPHASVEAPGAWHHTPPAERIADTIDWLTRNAEQPFTGVHPDDIEALLTAGRVDPSVLAQLLTSIPLTDTLVTAAARYPRPQIRHALVERYDQLTDSQRRTVDQAALTDTDAYVRAVTATKSTDLATVTALARCPEPGVRARAETRLRNAGHPTPDPEVAPTGTADRDAVLAAVDTPAYGQPLDADWEASSIASRLMAAGVAGILPPVNDTAARARAQLDHLTANADQYDIAIFTTKIKRAVTAGRATVETLKLLTAELALTWGETANIGRAREPQQLLLNVAATRTGAGTWQKPARNTGPDGYLDELTELLDGVVDAWMSETSSEAVARLRRAGYDRIDVTRAVTLDPDTAHDLGIPASADQPFTGAARHGVPVAAISSYSCGRDRDSYAGNIRTHATVPLDHIIALDGAVGAETHTGLTGLDIGEVLLTPLDPRRVDVEYQITTPTGTFTATPPPPGFRFPARNPAQTPVQTPAQAPGRAGTRREPARR